MILNRQRAVRVARRPLELFLCRVEKELRLGDADVTVCFVSDVEIARMNLAFRGKKGPTDVLSFPGERKKRKKLYIENSEGTEKRYLGDIAIAPATARRY